MAEGLRGFRVKVSNFSSQAQTVLVTDQIPVSETDRVVVKLGETTAPLPPEDEDGPGILKWKLDIPAGSEKVIDLRFSVTAPRELAEEQLQELQYMY